MTFNEFMPEFFAYKKLRVKPSTVAAYMHQWKDLKDEFGDIEIASISTKTVEKWAISKLSSLSRKTIEDYIVLLNNIIDFYGYEYEVPICKISRRHIHWPSVNIQHGEFESVKTYTPHEISLMLEGVVKNPTPANILISMMIASGMRIGEACALTYEDVNMESGVVEIKRTLGRICIGEAYSNEELTGMNIEIVSRSKNSAVVLSPPKCKASYRAVPIPRELLKILKNLKAVYPPTYYIGSNRLKPTEPRTLRQSYYKLLKEVGVDRQLTPHCLRHTYATSLITAGVDVTTTAALLGHGDAATTLGIYAHATRESKKKAMTSTIGKRFKSALTKSK